jgi:50S ribosomal protein L16 3-hydroxylase
MDLDRPQALLGGLSAAAFMHRHWQKRPLLIRAAALDALAGFEPRQLFALAARDDVESRLIVRSSERWSVRQGPLPRRALPPLSRKAWTLLVQGVDLHDERAHRLLARFRFVADARLDDVMVSFASDGGGVGPHVDSYDVFLLQIAGRRRWRVGPADPARLRDDVPLKMLAEFAPRHDWLLEPGDMLYLPPGWGHDGTGVGACLTASIGFRAPLAGELAADVLQRLAETAAGAADDLAPRLQRRYRDRGEPATTRPARITPGLKHFADEAIGRLAADRAARARALGEALSEPKPGTWFARRDQASALPAAIVLDRKTRMLYDERHIFINGESFRAAGRDRTLARRLADRRSLDARGVAALSHQAGELLASWLRAGWCVRSDDESSDEEGS